MGNTVIGVLMSFVISFKTENFVAIAGDKRITYIDGSGYEDEHRKVHKINNYIYSTAGSGEISKYFEQSNKANNLKDFIDYSNKFFNELQLSKEKLKEHWMQQKFDLTLIVAGIMNKKTYLSMYQISWKDEGIGFAKVPSTHQYPCYVMPPNLGNINDYTESYIKFNHPQTLEQTNTVVKHLMEKVSKESKEVSPEYDIEFMYI